MGFNGDTLAIFTGLTPAAMLAFAFMGFAIVFAVKDAQERERLAHWLAVPLAVAWVGFAAAATHLGMPSNALYVVSGIGRSSLSNEVATVVGFLFFAGRFWLYSFRLKGKQIISGIFLLGALVFAVLGIHYSAYAYDTATALTWNLWYTPISLWLSAVMGGAVLAHLTLVIAQGKVRPWCHAALMFGALVALAASTAVLCLQNEAFSQLFNQVTTFVAMFPHYGTIIFWRTVLCIVGLVLLLFSGAAYLWGRKADASRPWWTKTWLQVPVTLLGTVLVFAGILMIRFAFYEAYFPVGF